MEWVSTPASCSSLGHLLESRSLEWWSQLGHVLVIDSQWWSLITVTQVTFTLVTLVKGGPWDHLVTVVTVTSTLAPRRRLLLHDTHDPTTRHVTHARYVNRSSTYSAQKHEGFHLHFWTKDILRYRDYRRSAEGPWSLGPSGPGLQNFCRPAPADPKLLPRTSPKRPKIRRNRWTSRKSGG